MAVRVPSKQDMTNLKSLMKPPQTTKQVLSAMICLLGTPIEQAEEWSVMQKELADPNLLKKLEVFDPKSVVPEVHKFACCKISGITKDQVRQGSSAAVGVYMWVKGQLEAAKVKDVSASDVVVSAVPSGPKSAASKDIRL